MFGPGTWEDLVRGVFEIGYDFGSNKLYEVAYSNGASPKTCANTGFVLNAGVSTLPLLWDRLRTRATIGVKYTSNNASNASLSYYSFPLEVLETFEFGYFRLGAGIYKPLGSKVSGSGDLSSLAVSLESALGYTLRADFFVKVDRHGTGPQFRGAAWGVRYVRNRLTVNGSPMNAPAVGLLAAVDFDLL